MLKIQGNAHFVTRAAFGAMGLALLVAASVAPAQAKVLAKVNGVEITDEDVKMATDDLGPGIPRQLEGKARDAYILDFLIDEQLVVQKAQADKLAETPDFAKKLAYLRDKALMETLLGNVAKSAVTDAAIKNVLADCASATSNYYDANSTGDLTRAFSAIGSSLTAIRLSR